MADPSTVNHSQSQPIDKALGTRQSVCGFSHDERIVLRINKSIIVARQDQSESTPV